MGRENWVRVRSESELRVGMTVKISPNPYGWHAVQVLLGFGHVKGFVCLSCLSRAGWRVSPGHPKHGIPSIACNCRSIREGRLFRLETGIDDEAAQREGREIYAPRKAAVRGYDDRGRWRLIIRWYITTTVCGVVVFADMRRDGTRELLAARYVNRPAKRRAAFRPRADANAPEPPARRPDDETAHFRCES